MQRWCSLVLHLFCITSLTAASLPPQPPPPPTVNEEIYDELTPAQEEAMWADIQRNVLMLRSAGLLAAPDTTQTVLYNFPLRMAPGLPDYAGFSVSAFVDHNASVGSILDYNGGTRTYDGHRGTDYALYPFSWNKVNAGEVQVIAAAAGTIAYKGNTDPTDHNPCDGGSSNDFWNYIAITHADGRLTMYGHMRYNSLTSKGIGQTVAQGEYLGTAASSGSSTGPHLHFEVRYGTFTNAEWVDPYTGSANPIPSLWASQRPYYDSAINRLGTHAGQPIDVNCQPSLTNLQDSFTTPTNIYFYTYYRDYQGTLPTQFTIYKPNNDIFQQWTYIPGTAFSWAWRYGPPAIAFTSTHPAGTWRFEAKYPDQTTYQSFFNLNAPTAITVTSPNGGEYWDTPIPHTVTWADNLGGEVNILLYRNGVYSATLVTNTSSDGDYSWTPGPTLATGPGYTLHVVSVISPTLYDASNAPFALGTPPTLNLTKTASISTPQPGQPINYIVKITNSGSNTATGARLTDSLPVSLTQAGTITLNPPGLGTVGTLPNAVTNITLAAGQSLTVTIPVMVNNGQAAGTLITNTASITCTEILTPVAASTVITLANAPLVARDDVVLTPLDTPTTIDVLGNDGDPNGDAMTITALGVPLSGTASLSGVTVVYTPTVGFLGAEVFTYTVNTSAESATATVTVWVVPEVFKLYLPIIRR